MKKLKHSQSQVFDELENFFDEARDASEPAQKRVIQDKLITYIKGKLQESDADDAHIF